MLNYTLVTTQYDCFSSLYQVVEENPDPEMTLLYYLRNKSECVYVCCAGVTKYF